MKHAWLMGVVLLSGCAEPQFGFRGYTDVSDCRNVIDAELAGGSEFEDFIDADLARGEGVATQLRGELFSVPVRIFVSCYSSGAVDGVDYIAEAADLDTSGAFFAKMAVELDAIFGEPQQIFAAESRSRVYLCGDPATVVLREARHGDMDFEVSLLVIPRFVEC